MILQYGFDTDCLTTTNTWALTTFWTDFCSDMSSHTSGGGLKIPDDMSSHTSGGGLKIPDDLKKAIQRSIRQIPENSLVKELEKLKTHLNDAI